jgi:hypothetical protein
MANKPSGKAQTNYNPSSAPAGNLVPNLTDFFDSWPQASDANSGKPGWKGKLSRTWYLFFRSLGAPAGGATPIIGWWMPGVAPGATNLPALAAGRAGPLTQVAVVVVASDPSTNLSFDILQNGASIFTQPPVIQAGTAAGTELTITNLALPISVAQDDVFTFNMIAGSTAWFFSVQAENAITAAN